MSGSSFFDQFCPRVLMFVWLLGYAFHRIFVAAIPHTADLTLFKPGLRNSTRLPIPVYLFPSTYI